MIVGKWVSQAICTAAADQSITLTRPQVRAQGAWTVPAAEDEVPWSDREPDRAKSERRRPDARSADSWLCPLFSIPEYDNDLSGLGLLDVKLRELFDSGFQVGRADDRIA